MTMEHLMAKTILKFHLHIYRKTEKKTKFIDAFSSSRFSFRHLEIKFLQQFKSL